MVIKFSKQKYKIDNRHTCLKFNYVYSVFKTILSPMKVSHLILSLLFSFSLTAQNAECIQAYNEAVAFVKQKDYKSAIKAYGQAITHDPSYDKAYYNRGTALLRLKDYDQAQKDFAKTVKLSPEYGKAHYYLGYTKMKKDDLKGALVDFSRALKFDNSLTDAFYYRGYIQMKDNNLETAIRDFEDAAQIDPENHKLHYNAGLCHYKLKNYVEAVNSFTMTMDLKPAYNKSYYYRAMSFLKLEKNDKAIADFTSGIESEPAVELLYNRGLLYSKQDEQGKALTDYVSALKIKPDHIPSLKNSANIYLKQKDYKASANVFQQLQALEKDEESHYLNAGICHFNNGSYADGEKSLSALITMKPDHAEALFNRANTYAKLGQMESACKDIRKSAELGFDKAFEYVAGYCQQ